VDDQRFDNEGPVHDVTLDPYFLAKHEVSQGQWIRLFANNPSQYQPGVTHGGQSFTLRAPVTNVDWHGCREACHRWGLVLPTESQWEYACRAGTSTRYFTGDEMASLKGFANIADENFIKDGGTGESDFYDGFAAQASIGVLKPNAFALHDVHGNVWEWCLDRFDANAYGDFETATGDGLRIPWHGIGIGVLRGGSFRYVARIARSAMRRPYDPAARSFNVGFRPALSVTTF
jgi:formylglycine-generating enzyme required for sulfatase activity